MGSKGRPARRADNLTVIYEPSVYKMWEPRRLTTLWAFMATYRHSFTLLAAGSHNLSVIFSGLFTCTRRRKYTNTRKKQHTELQYY
jgi:hypothetical protein